MNLVNSKKISGLVSSLTLGIGIAFVSCSAATTSEPSKSTSQVSQSSPQLMSQAQSQSWQRINSQAVERQRDYVLHSPLGIAALNQLAIEGFIAPNCTKTWYVNQNTEFQSLLQVKCPTPRGVSTARGGFSEIRVIFNRFESSIENFEIQRIYDEDSAKNKLPE
jgi:hypothetical protein